MENGYGYKSFSSAWAMSDLIKTGVGRIWRIMGEDYKLVDDGKWLTFEKVTEKKGEK
jgi:hypothetical protein